MNIVKSLMYQWLLGFITTANVQKLLQLICEKLGEKAEGTENQLDDIGVDALKYIANDEGKVKVIVDFITTQLGKNPKECSETPEEVALDYENLAMYVSAAGTRRTNECGAFPIELIARVLMMILPEIIEYFKKEKE